MTPELSSGSAVLFVADIEVSKRFYTELLGLKIKLDFGKNVTYDGFTIWEIRSSHIIAERLGTTGLIDKTSNRFELYFETDDLESMISMLESNNVNLLHELHEEPWGQRTIRFFDPDNHLIEAGESLKKFLGRFHESGMSPEEISRKTSVAVEDIKHILGVTGDI